MKKAEKDIVVDCTEKYLRHRNVKKYYKKEKQKRKNFLQDWVGSLLWAAVVVFILNQYFFQAYAIPSGSMIDTLRVSDRLFVDKLSMGPEILPGIGKLNFKDPTRSDIIIFENPEYKSKGTVFNITHRMLYMLSFSLVDIDKEYNPRTGRKEPSKHFLIKRAVSADRDFFKFDYGSAMFKPHGAKEYYPQSVINNDSFKLYNSQRTTTNEEYKAAAKYKFQNLIESKGESDVTDYEDSKIVSMYGAMLMPHSDYKLAFAAKSNLGWYIPDNYKLPLGDNRDNSLDGRYFGPISDKKITGKAGLIYYPFDRAGIVK